MLFTAALQVTAIAIVKIMGTQVNVAVAVLLYYLVPCVLFLPTLYRLGRTVLATKHFGFYLLRGVLSVLAVYCLFYSAQQVNLALVTVLFNTTPLFIPIIASLCLQEHATLKQWIGIVIAAGGVLVALYPGLHGLFSPIAFFALASGILMAISQVMLRKLAQDGESTHTIVFYQYACCTLVALCIIVSRLAIHVLHSGTMPVFMQSTVRNILLLLCLGSLCFVGQRVLALAFRQLPAALLAPLLYISVPLSALLDWVFWGQTVTSFMLIGTILIVAGLCVMNKRSTP